MGMLQNGQWTVQDRIIEGGAYVRRPGGYGDAIGPDLVEAMAADPGRFHLVASASCPWSHRALIVRRLKGLDQLVPVHIAWGPRLEGYAIAGGASWQVPGTHRKIVHLHELYTLADPSYTGRSTVPVLWDSHRLRIISNESAMIMRALDAVRAPGPALDFTLTPERLVPEIDAINARVYERLSNGVYRALFAERQHAYDAAVADVFGTLDALETRLASRRYLLGNTLTEADWRLFPTLFRFDTIYYVQHRCMERRLVDLPRLWAYARDLYSWRGIAEAVALEAMRSAGYLSDASNTHRIVPVAPRADWHAPHGREALGAARIALRTGEEREVDPATLAREPLHKSGRAYFRSGFSGSRRVKPGIAVAIAGFAQRGAWKAWTKRRRPDLCRGSLRT